MHESGFGSRTLLVETLNWRAAKVYNQAEGSAGIGRHLRESSPVLPPVDENCLLMLSVNIVVPFSVPVGKKWSRGIQKRVYFATFRSRRPLRFCFIGLKKFIINTLSA